MYTDAKYLHGSSACVISCLNDRINLSHTVTVIRNHRHGWNDHMTKLAPGAFLGGRVQFFKIKARK